MKHIKPFNESLIQKIDFSTYFKSIKENLNFNEEEIQKIKNIFTHFTINILNKKSSIFSTIAEINLYRKVSYQDCDVQIDLNLSKLNNDDYFIITTDVCELYPYGSNQNRTVEVEIESSYYKIDDYEGLKEYHQYLIYKY